MKLIHFVVLSLLAFWGQGNVVRISPKGKKELKRGETVMLRCSYDPRNVTSVAWFTSDGVKVDKSDNRRILKSSRAITLTFKDLQVEDSGTYSCSGLLRNGSNINPSVKLIIVDPPKDAGTDKKQNFTIHSTATVICKVNGDPTPRVSWNFEDNPITETDRYSFHGDNLIIRNVTKADEGRYSCVASLASGEYEEIAVQVSILIPPKIHRWLRKVELIEGREKTLVCSATGDPSPDIRWHRSNNEEEEAVKIGNSSYLNLYGNRSLEGAILTCIASNAAGSTSSTTKIKVHVPPTIKMLKTVSVAEGDGATFNCVADGVPTPTVKFYKEDLNEDGNDVETGTVSMFGNETLGSWAPAFNVVRNRKNSTAKITFPSVTFMDRGSYVCEATSDAGYQISYLELDVKYPPKPRKQSNVWSCNDPVAVATLKCIFDANPAVNYTWRKYPLLDGAENGTDAEALNELSEGFEISKDGDWSVLNIMFNAVKDPFGTYLCTAENELGDISGTIKLLEVGKPPAPYHVGISDVGTRDATVVPYIHSSYGETVYKNFSVSLTTFDGNSTDDKKFEVSYIPYRLTNLTPDTTYHVSAAAENCYGIGNWSDVYAFTTAKITRPDSVNVTSNAVSDSHNSYDLRWRLNSLGGGEVKNIVIALYKIIVGIDSDEKEFIDVFEVRDQVVNAQNGSYKLQELSAISNYEVRVTIVNDVGNATAMKRFSTSQRSILAADNSTRPDFAASSTTEISVIIIVAVLFAIIVTVDLACCCLKGSGLTHFICVHTCMKKPMDDEEGGAHFRKDKCEDSEDKAADEEKRPLADDVDTANSRDPTLSKIDETEEPTPSSNKDDAPSPNGNGTVDGGAESEISRVQNE